MPQTTNPFSDVGTTTAETAARLARISMDSAERAFTVQLEYAKGAFEQAALNAKALSGAKDLQELLTLRSRITENSVENWMGYSRSLYEVASEAQTEIARLAEERMTKLQQTVSESVDQAARSVPAGGDIAAAAIKSSLAATTAAFDSFTKAARHAASFADAGLGAAGAKTRK